VKQDFVKFANSCEIPLFTERACGEKRENVVAHLKEKQQIKETGGTNKHLLQPLVSIQREIEKAVNLRQKSFALDHTLKLMFSKS
jgi:hypothetical protein